MAANCIRIPIRSWLAILFIAVGSPAFALDPSLRLSQYVLDNWQIPEGLPQSSAQAIARTPDGYLWVGTQEGLARFDGVRFTVFNGENEAGILDKYDLGPVRRPGRAAVDRHTLRRQPCSRKGISRRPHGSAGLAHAYVHAIVEDKSGHMWVGTESGLFEIDGGSASLVQCLERPARRAHPIAARGPRRGAVGGHRRRSAALRRHALRHRAAWGRATRVHRSRRCTPMRTARLWIGTGNGALYRRTGDQLDVVAGPGRLGSLVSALTRDRDGNLWIGTRGGGLVRWRNGSFDTLASNQFATSDLQVAVGGRRRKSVGRQPQRRPAPVARWQICIGRRVRRSARQPDVDHDTAPGRRPVGRLGWRTQQLRRRSVSAHCRAARS